MTSRIHASIPQDRQTRVPRLAGPSPAKAQGPNKPCAPHADSNSRGWAATLLKGAGLAFLALPAAAAGRPLTGLPGSDIDVGLQHTGRALKTCSSGLPPLPTVTITGDTSANMEGSSPFAKAVMSPYTWHKASYDQCSGVTTQEAIGSLEYTFLPQDPPSGASAIASSDAVIGLLKSDMNGLAGQLGIGFSDASSDGVSRDAPLLFAQDTNWLASSSWDVSLPGQCSSDKSISCLVRQFPSANTAAQRLQALGVALGLKYPGTSGVDSYTLPIGAFADNTLSSLMSTQDNANVTSTQFGPLDLLALSNKYDLNAFYKQSVTFNLDSNSGVGGLIASGNYDNQVAANAGGPNLVQLTMADDGTSANHVGNAVLLWAPGSRVVSASLANSTSGIILGNNLTNNTMVGSAYGDGFWPGVAATNITTGGGADSIVIRYPNSQVTVRDFSTSDTIYAAFTNQQSPSFGVTSDGASGSVVFFGPSNVTVNLPSVGVSAFKPASVVGGTSLLQPLPVPGTAQATPPPKPLTPPPPPHPTTPPPPPPSPVTTPPSPVSPPPPPPPPPKKQSSPAIAIAGAAGGAAALAGAGCILWRRKRRRPSVPAAAPMPAPASAPVSTPPSAMALALAPLSREHPQGNAAAQQSTSTSLRRDSFREFVAANEEV